MWLFHLKHNCSGKWLIHTAYQLRVSVTVHLHKHSKKEEMEEKSDCTNSQISSNL